MPTTNGVAAKTKTTAIKSPAVGAAKLNGTAEKINGHVENGTDNAIIDLSAD